MIEFGQIIHDMDGHNVIGVVLSFSNEEFVTIRLMRDCITIVIETPTENIAMKDGKPCVNFRWA